MIGMPVGKRSWEEAREIKTGKKVLLQAKYFIRASNWRPRYGKLDIDVQVIIQEIASFHTTR